MIVIHINNDNYKTVLEHLGQFNEDFNENMNIVDYIERIYVKALENGIVVEGVVDATLLNELEQEIIKNKAR